MKQEKDKSENTPTTRPRGAYKIELKDRCKNLYIQGYKAKEIAERIGVELRTIYYWIARESWDEATVADADFVIRRRLSVLLDLEEKSDSQHRELQSLLSYYENLAKHKERQLADRRRENRGAGEGKRRAGKNDFTHLTKEDILTKFKEGLFDYQLYLFEKWDEKVRDILKSRQIGATYYFAREAFAKALLTGRNQVFLSASRAQAGIFREYIKGFALSWFGVEITGKDMLKINTTFGQVEFHFLSTNSATSQGYHGDLYIDEYFWIPRFKKLRDLADGMASHSQYKITYFSTPSAKSHPGYAMWSGDEYNERNRRAGRKLEVFPDRKALRDGGRVCPDGQWRYIITLDDAIANGCNLFDKEELQKRIDPMVYEQLYNCEFIDDSMSVFRFTDLEKCLEDAADWGFFDIYAPRPYGDNPVWIGYDPSRTRDGAAIVVLAAPKKPGGKFYVLERIKLFNVAWEQQAEVIRELTQKYNVEHIGIDVTGPGSGVYEMVSRFFPAAKALWYDMKLKDQLILKAKQIIQGRRIAWDVDHSDIAAGFMMIRQTTSGSDLITYKTDRSEATGHGDTAWAVMNALVNEELVIDEYDGEQDYIG